MNQFYRMYECSDCERDIESDEQVYFTDKTGLAVCVECADNHLDVTLGREAKNH
jgi:Zn finger protein HypA/HybF involved in hydrogenase expression